MPTINASKYGYLVQSSTTSFAALRNGTTALQVNNQPSSSNAIGVRFRYVTGGKGSEWQLHRSYWAFDTSTYSSGYTITDLEIKFDPTTSTSTNFPVAVIKSTAQGDADTNLVSGDWDSLDFSTLYSANSSTNYWPDTNSVSTIDLNSTAVTAFGTGILKVAIVWWFDYNNGGGLATPQTINAYQNFGYVPRLQFTATPTGYGNDVNDVSSSDISKIIDVASADINKVIDVS
jgi:hypothetical protein|tara:strand:+ start:1154 stop:1849 length:696 start_codon:yes stop_codon:yes gene_type:complete